MTPGVSVVLCTRNGQSRGFLGEALDSVASQTTRPSELILVDDRSTDETASWVHREFPWVVVIPNAGAGLAAARNTGIRAARQRLIAFIDDDDLWLPDKLTEQLAQVATSASPDSTIWATRAEFLFSERGNKRGEVPTPLHLTRWPECLLGCPVWHSGALLPRELLHRVGSFDESLASGSAYQYWIRCLQAGAEVHYTQRVLLILRRHRDQMTSHHRMNTRALQREQMLMPFLDGLPPRMAARISAANKLVMLRALLWRCGFAAARRYCRDAALGAELLSPRPLGYLAIATASNFAPTRLADRIRSFAPRVLALRQAEGRKADPANPPRMA